MGFGLLPLQTQLSGPQTTSDKISGSAHNRVSDEVKKMGGSCLLLFVHVFVYIFFNVYRELS